MNKLALIAAAGLTAGTFGFAAVAQDTSSTDFVQYDANKDGMVSYEEAVGAYPTLTEAIFNQADTNGDGSLDEAEFGGLKGLTAGLDDDGVSEEGGGDAATDDGNNTDDGDGDDGNAEDGETDDDNDAEDGETSSDPNAAG